MPEEINRIVVDHISDRMYAPTIEAKTNLISENLGFKTLLAGDVTLESIVDIASKLNFNNSYYSEPFILFTLHRAENVDDKIRLESILAAIGKIDMRIILFGHPRLVESIKIFGSLMPKNVEFRDAVSFTELLTALNSADHVITDSGGLQKEAYILGKPCITLRSETEWVETIKTNWNILCNDMDDLNKCLSRTISSPNDLAIFGSGNAANIITNDIQDFLQ